MARLLRGESTARRVGLPLITMPQRSRNLSLQKIGCYIPTIHTHCSRTPYPLQNTAQRQNVRPTFRLER